jgi:IS30 family transposase
VRRARPKALRLASDARLRARVAAMLGRRLSPEQVAGRLAREHPGDRRWRVSHTAIYNAVYLLGRQRLFVELDVALRSRRPVRRARGVPYDRIAGLVPISARPAEAADRLVPGHWEGDLLIGARSASAIATLVERTSRFTVLVPLPAGRTSPAVVAALIAALTRLPAQMLRSLTWDRGPEMAGHAAFKIATGVTVYFADAYSPQQRGTNENTNGLIREFLPKGTSLDVGQARLDEIAELLNTRPRKVLDFATPAEVFNQLIEQAS